MEVLILIIVLFTIFCSIAAWINTKIIIQDIAKIKQQLGITEEKPKTFLSDDLDD